MKINKIILLLLIVTSLLFGCVKRDQSYKGFATEFVDLNKEFVMSSCKIICKTNKETPISFGEKKTCESSSKTISYRTLLSAICRILGRR